MNSVEPGVRLPVELYETLRRMAAKNGRSLNAEIVAALDDYAGAFRRYEQRRDEDRDGVPDRYDRDRDGDGVPNDRDAQPDNPRRY